MKKAFLVLAAGAFLWVACDNAANKIKDENRDITSNENVTPAPMEVPQPEPALEVTVESVDTENLPEFKFAKEEHNFGKIKSGEKVKTVFTFINTGKGPLIISSAKGSCGCTVPRFPGEPIAPGGKGEIEVEFDSAGKGGVQSKTVTVTANTIPNTKVLTITADIQTEEAAQNQ
jgi:hypothetical protein